MNDKNKDSIKAQEKLQKSFNEIDINGDKKIIFWGIRKKIKKIICAFFDWFLIYVLFKYK